jgi:hypothetical protein
MERIDVLLEPLRAILVQIGQFLPRLAIALVVLLVGLLIAKAARFAVEKALRAINFNILTQRAGLDSFLQQGGSGIDTIYLVGLLAYWTVVIAALIIAFSGMGLTHVTDLLSRALLFVPKILVALLVVVLGSYFARFVSNVIIAYCQGIGMRDADILGRLARYAIVAFVVMMALDQLEIGGTIVHDAFLLVLGGLMLAFAIAFGLGGKDWAAAHLERWWPAPKRDRLP